MDCFPSCTSTFSFPWERCLWVTVGSCVTIQQTIHATHVAWESLSLTERSRWYFECPSSAWFVCQKIYVRKTPVKCMYQELQWQTSGLNVGCSRDKQILPLSSFLPQPQKQEENPFSSSLDPSSPDLLFSASPHSPSLGPATDRHKALCIGLAKKFVWIFHTKLDYDWWLSAHTHPRQVGLGVKGGALTEFQLPHFLAVAPGVTYIAWAVSIVVLIVLGRQPVSLRIVLYSETI